MKNKKIIRLLAIFCLTFLVQIKASNAEVFAIEDIEVTGVSRVDIGTVLNYLPYDVNDQFDAKIDSAIAIRSLYKTGLFSDVTLSRRGDTLLISIEERPAIAEVKIEGNRQVSDDQLEESLRGVGISRGRVFNRSMLDSVEQELRRLYFSTGHYAVKIDAKVTPLERNRVAIFLDIIEGESARIQSINIIGNSAYSDEELLDLLDSGEYTINPFSSADEYSKAKLAGDIETLRSHYQNRGYMRFDVESTQVSISADKQDIFITMNISEGDRYDISDVKLAGDLKVPETELQEIITELSGIPFSREKMLAKSDAVSDRLGEDGYAFANVNVVPNIDEDAKQVALTYQITPGKRVYVRRILFRGNGKTRDEVFRREMRLMEGGLFSPSKLRRSKVRIQRLSYIADVSVETPRVPGTDDQVDIVVSLTEGSSGSFGIGLGYGTDGFLFNINFSQDNLFGSGESMKLSYDNSSSVDQFSLSFTDPYYTVDGVSRTWSAFYRKTDASEVSSTADYLMDSFGGGLSFGVPLSEYSRVSFGANFKNVELTETKNTSQEIKDFLAEKGNDFNLFSLTTSYSHDTRDRTVFATDGMLNKLSLEATVPSSDLEFYKLSYGLEYFTPITKSLVFSLRNKISYGSGYGDSETLPFFERYYAGGIRSVRGYRSSSLGPRDSENSAMGGDYRFVGTTELIFPPPFAAESGRTRFGVFMDYGNVFTDYDNFDVDELRGSYGVSFVWLSPVGPLTFSLADTFNDEPEDRTQSFQFTIGSVF